MEQISLNIGTIGQKFETARRDKGVTVSEAGHATRILARFIEAMEHDDFGVLSAPVYAKSFIRIYAKYLGLEDQPLVDEYVSKYVQDPNPPLTEETRQQVIKVDKNRPADISAVGSSNRQVFGGVNAALGNLSAPRISMRSVIIAVVGIVVLIGVFASVKQCVGDDEGVTAPAGGAALEKRQLLYDRTPNLYLDKPGQVQVD